MAIGAEAVRKMELRRSTRGSLGRSGRCGSILRRSPALSLPRGPRRREQPMDADKCEKSLDNRCAALVSREGRAPRAKQDRKRCTVNRLCLVSLLIRARGAQVSRAAREHIVHLSAPLAARPAVSLSNLFFGRYHSFAASQERRPPKMRTCPERESKGCHSVSHECHTQSDRAKFVRGSARISYVIQMRPESRIYSPRASFWDIL